MSSIRVAVVYHSGHGHTGRQAEAVKAGVEQVQGTEALLLTVGEAQTRWDDLASAEAIIFEEKAGQVRRRKRDRSDIGNLESIRV
jgi:NAD(P)H dehydrogenase (quinone)